MLYLFNLYDLWGESKAHDKELNMRLFFILGMCSFLFSCNPNEMKKRQLLIIYVCSKSGVEYLYPKRGVLTLHVDQNGKPVKCNKSSFYSHSL